MNEREIFNAVREIDDVSARASFLDTACAGDTATRERVLRLLKASAQNDPFVDRELLPHGLGGSLLGYLPLARAENQDQLADIPLDRFTQLLHASGVISSDDWSKWVAGSTALGETSSRILAEELVRQQKLTPFQAEQLCRGQSLVLGKYLLIDRLGAGGMGLVLKAEHRRMKRLVALKILPPDIAQSPESLRRFQREVEATAKLRHPNLVTAHDADEVDGVPFLVMEYVAGIDLSRFVKAYGPLSVGQALTCVVEAARGLEFAHRNGVIHRDIKPANMMLEHEGTLKILDLGLARVDSDLSLPTDTSSSGLMMGTVDYIAPEQSLNANHSDARSDIYSLGMSLWYLLTGQAAYSGDSLLAKLLAHREAPIPRIGSLRKEITEEVENLFQRMVAKRPEDRLSSMADVIVGAEACLRQEATAAGEEKLVHGAERSALNVLASLTIVDVATAEMHVDPTFVTTSLPMRTQSLPVVTPLSTVSAEDRSGSRRVPQLLPAVVPPWWSSRRWSIAGGFAAALLLGVIVITITKRDGTKTRLEVPDDATVEITTASDIPPLAENPPVTNWSGWSNKTPPPAIAPFDATQARQHQEAWAKHLQVEVEYTNSIGMKFILIPPGEFLMGSTPGEIELALVSPDVVKQWWECIQSEAPQHKVILTQPIFLGVTEVTQGHYQDVTGVNPAHYSAEGAGKATVAGFDARVHPVETVNWNDAAKFCQQLSQREQQKPFYGLEGGSITSFQGTGYRLPSEAEWEFACRAGTTTKFWSGDQDEDLSRVGWWGGSSGDRIHAAGEAPVNPFGLSDMHGNVWEWVQDGWQPNWYLRFQEHPAMDPFSPLSSEGNRMMRGGDYYFTSSGCRSAVRHFAPHNYGYLNIGFRVALSVDAVKTARVPRSPPADPASPTP